MEKIELKFKELDHQEKEQLNDTVYICKSDECFQKELDVFKARFGINSSNDTQGVEFLCVLPLQEQDKIVVDNLERISKELGYTMAQVSLAWMLSKPYVTSPIVGFTSEKHVDEAVKALDIKLSNETIKALEAPYVPHIKTGAF